MTGWLFALSLHDRRGCDGVFSARARLHRHGAGVRAVIQRVEFCAVPGSDSGRDSIATREASRGEATPSDGAMGTGLD